MRHFFALPRQISGLALSVPTRPTTAALVTHPRLAHARTAAYRSATATAKLLTTIATRTELHLRVTSLAVEEPIEILDRWPRPPDFWTQPSRSAKLAAQPIAGWKGSVTAGPFAYLGSAIIRGRTPSGPISRARSTARIWAWSPRDSGHDRHSAQLTAVWDAR
jgi:hypothetical protein